MLEGLRGWQNEAEALGTSKRQFVTLLFVHSQESERDQEPECLENKGGSFFYLQLELFLAYSGAFLLTVLQSESSGREPEHGNFPKVVRRGCKR